MNDFFIKIKIFIEILEEDLDMMKSRYMSYELILERF